MTRRSTLPLNRALPAVAAGFTLIEMLVAMTLVSLIMIVALDAFDGTRRVSRKNLSVSDAQQQGSYGLQELAVTLRRTGYQLGPTYAILKNFSSNGTVYTSSWDQYPNGGAAVGIWSLEPAGSIPFTPVDGTDGITVKYGDDQPPIHVCVMPSANANNMDLSWDPAYAAYYPVSGQTIDVITTSLCATAGQQGTNVMTVTVNNVNSPPSQCSNAGGGGQSCTSNPDTCYCKDPLCVNLQGTQACYHFTFVSAPGCDFCQKGPSYIVASKSASFWISTEDHTGAIYKAGGGISRPVLVGRYGSPLTNATRIIANDVEDLQIAYLLNVNNVVQESQTVPVNIDLPKTRAFRINLTARTGVTDLMAKNYAYCSSKAPTFTQLFSRPAMENHGATAAAAGTDYCDGLRRVVYNQVVNLPNMTSYPIGRLPAI